MNSFAQSVPSAGFVPRDLEIAEEYVATHASPTLRSRQHDALAMAEAQLAEDGRLGAQEGARVITIPSRSGTVTASPARSRSFIATCTSLRVAMLVTLAFCSSASTSTIAASRLNTGASTGAMWPTSRRCAA